MATVDILVALEEYLQMPDTGRQTELVRGRIVEMNPPYPWHGFICSRIDRLTGNFADSHDLGRVMCNDSGVVTERNPDTLRGADVCFYSYQRLPKGPIARRSYFDVMPELVFEVRSPSDRWREVLEKVAEYLRAGVLVVCVVDPEAYTVTVYESDSPTRVLNKDDMLTLPQVLPGFAVKVAQLFE